MVFCLGLTQTSVKGVNTPVVIWEGTARQRFRRIKQQDSLFGDNGSSLIVPGSASWYRKPSYLLQVLGRSMTIIHAEPISNPVLKESLTMLWQQHDFSEHSQWSMPSSIFDGHFHHEAASSGSGGGFPLWAGWEKH